MNLMAKAKKAASRPTAKDEQAEIKQLRVLAHDLSNSLEAILQAAYLLTQSKLDDHSRRWVELIDISSQQAAKINREIRKHLRLLSSEDD
jgi:nitrogen-specific signal transduction histidine kinase